MNVLTLNEKGGFLSHDKEIKIFDDKGKEFYFFIPKKSPIHFNLPKGIYLTDNKLFRVKPKQYKIKVFKKEKEGYSPNNMNIYLTDKYGLGFTDIQKKNIGLHPELINKPKYCLAFVYAHELGHNYYFDENKCDLFATNLMLAWGFNKSQIVKAKDLTLKNKKRVCENLQLLKKL